MGEYADMDVDAGIETWRGSGAPRGRGAQYWPGDYPPQYTKVAKRCRYCGVAPLYWEQIAGRGQWRLHAYEGGKYVLHHCDSGSEAKPENAERSGAVEPEGSQSGDSVAGASPNPSTPGENP